MVETTSSSVACVFDGDEARRRVASAEPPASSAMTAQATTTGSVIGDRADVEQRLEASAATSREPPKASHAEASRAASTPTAAARNGPAPMARDDGERGRQADEAQRLHGERRAPSGPSRIRTTLHHSEPKCAAPSAAPPAKATMRTTKLIADASIAMPSIGPPRRRA